MAGTGVDSNRWSLFGTATVAAMLAAGLAVPALADDGNPCLPTDAIEDQLILELEDDGDINVILAQATALYPQIRVLFNLPGHDDYLLSVPEPLCESQVKATLMALPGVEEVEYNEEGETSHGQTQSFFFGALQTDFDFQYAWDLLGVEDAHSVTLGKGVVVAIIDSGLDEEHPLIAGTPLITGYNFIGTLDGSGDWPDGLDNDNDGSIDEMTGHGTFIAGIVRQIAPAATILPLRAMDSDGQGDTFAVASALLEAMEEGADVINISFGCVESSSVIKTLIDDATAMGSVVVVSGGNTNQGAPLFPAKMGVALAVASTDANDVLSPFSAIGSQIDVCAPGKDAVGSVPGGGYAFASGTSVAAAFGTGAAALVKALHPEMTSLEVRNHIKATSTPIAAQNPGFDGLIGAGRLNIARAVGAELSPDLDGSGTVNMTDLSLLLSAWGTPNADLDGNGTTDPTDLSLLIAAWSF